MVLVEIPDAVDVVDDEGTVEEEPVLVGMLDLVVVILNQVGTLVEALLEPLVPTAVEIHVRHGGPSESPHGRRHRGYRNNRTYTPHLYDLLCVFGDTRWIAPTPETIPREALWVWVNPPKWVWGSVLGVPRWLSHFATHKQPLVARVWSFAFSVAARQDTDAKTRSNSG